MLALIAAAAVAAAAPVEYPEPTPALIEACLANAAKTKEVSRVDGRWKYICAGKPAETLWYHLAALNQPSWEQVVEDGTWLSRAFPLGGCFMKVKNRDGSPASAGLSCTIWIPSARG